MNWRRGGRGSRYPLHKWMAICVITVGIIYLTLVNTNSIALFSGSCCSDKAFAHPVARTAAELFQDAADAQIQMIGVALLVSALLLVSLLGHLQSESAKNYGADWRERMFYSHALSLVTAVLFAGDLSRHVAVWGSEIWVLVLGNVLTQYICMCGVQYLTERWDPVTFSLLLTMRKFVSLLASIYVFRNAFGVDHIVGTVVVFGGTAWYYLGESKPKPDIQIPADKKKD
eukprot:TRINITY_DN567_c0_g4_i2.p2 TRINITY_DN567_c0_g4~~TRINITY_DN567_c0_g4_i2.p2  ORF type:complete len:229 (-),score=68.42 TRINITY_DN567_c0_g4_i2:12-698(-)